MHEQSQGDTVFLQGLDKSRESVWITAKWLNGLGYPVTVNVAPVRDKHKNWKNYADHGDIEISQRVEVKHLTVPFTNKQDWPFKDKFIVCAKHSYDFAIPKPYMYIIVDDDYSHVAVVRSDSKPHWYVENKRDSRYVEEVYEQDFYLCPMEHVMFLPMIIFSSNPLE